MIDWKPSPEASLEQEEDWDPMKQDSESIRNGLISIETLNSAEISCPYQKEPYTLCFKGRHCPYQHGQYTPDMKIDHPKLQDRPRTCLLLAKNLPKQKFEFPKGLVTQAWVTTVVSPSQFWVVLKNGANCLCKGQHEGADDGHRHGQELSTKRSSSSLEQLGILWTNMQNHYVHVKERPSQYFGGELVAVRVNIGGGGDGPSGRNKGWVRALVLEDTDPDLDADQAPLVSLKLLDYGLNLVMSAMECAPLHEKFGNDAPMAIHCSLFGISPVLGKWGVKGTEYFKEVISGQLVLVQVQEMQTPSKEDHTLSEGDMLAQPPILVSLIVKSQGKFLRVGESMKDLGLAVESNPRPTSSVLPNGRKS